MQQIDITNLSGTPPFSIDVCDYTISYCENVLSGIVSAPVTFLVPNTLIGQNKLIVKVTDSNGCDEFSFVQCPTPTPTNSPTPTMTPTNINTNCLCILFKNNSGLERIVQYTDCSDNVIIMSISGFITVPRCGRNPSSESLDVEITLHEPCISGNCPPESLTPTPTQTPSNTPTISITPSNTPTISITPTETPTNTPTPTMTPTNTPTPTMTPTMTLPPLTAFLFIEEISGNTEIGNWMYTINGLDFWGFSNGSQPTANFQNEMVAYVDFTGWTNGYFPSVITQSVPQSSGGNDSFGNPIVAYNFITTQVSANTASDAWYTWLIPTYATNNLIQKQIDYSTSNPSILTTVNTESTIYNNTFYYSGGTIPAGTYRVYTTFPGENFNLDNTTDIYFRGNSVS